ncbi:MAG: hypothetical protein JNG89_19550 [Planctomycetaceae bacterium]|nr:hypothetical protein [Planctomycetaceae bacterium]
MTTAVFFTAVVWYVGCYGYWNWLKGRDFAGTSSVSRMEWDDALFAPLDSYSLSSYPGHQQLDTFARLWHDKGSGADVTWSDIADDYETQPVESDPDAAKSAK